MKDIIKKYELIEKERDILQEEFNTIIKKHPEIYEIYTFIKLYFDYVIKDQKDIFKENVSLFYNILFLLNDKDSPVGLSEKSEKDNILVLYKILSNFLSALKNNLNDKEAKEKINNFLSIPFKKNNNNEVQTLFFSLVKKGKTNELKDLSKDFFDFSIRELVKQKTWDINCIQYPKYKTYKKFKWVKFLF